MKRTRRPISPHLGVYRFAWPMLYSITHRLSGVVVTGWVFWICLWLVALKLQGVWLEFLQCFNASVFGFWFVLISVWALSFHFANGIRHLLWDIGLGFSLPVARWSGHLVMILSVIATALALLYVF